MYTLTGIMGSNPILSANKNRTFVYRQMFCFCLSKPQAWHIITTQSCISSALRAVSHARARSPFARWHSVLRSVFNGTLAEQSARGSLVQARTHSRLIITRQRVSPFVLMIYRNKLRMIYKAYALIYLRLCDIIIH